MASESAVPKLPSVALTVATTGTLRRETAASIMVVARDERATFRTILLNERPYEAGMNLAARSVIDTPDIDWWLHIDADQYWKGDPLAHLDSDLDLISFPAPIYRGSGAGPGAPVMQFNAWHLADPEDDTHVMPVHANGTLARVDIIGSGSFIVRAAALREARLVAPFSRRYDADGIPDRGPDIEFSRKWRESGRQLWADFGCVCGHFSTVDLLDVFTDMVSLRTNNADPQQNGKPQAARIVRPGIRPV